MLSYSEKNRYFCTVNHTTFSDYTMKRLIYTLMLACMALTSQSSPLMTKWGENLDKTDVWNVYPRPTMARDDWKNLNGEWDYAITPKNARQPSVFDGKILVPFCVESALSGVERRVGADSVLWYRRTFEVPKSWAGKEIHLNFEAVDWQTTVWVNGICVGGHTGGYTPFGMDITQALKRGVNTLTVKVYDPTDKGYQPRGKQVSNPNSIWYTPVTGIWQTVWLEPVSPTHIEKLKITPDIDKGTFTVDAATSGADRYEVSVKDVEGRVVARGAALSGQSAIVEMPSDFVLWSTDNPYIYDIEVSAVKDGKVTDSVRSYGAMRKVGMARKEWNRPIRFTLNDRQIFHLGPLDQGWWPDGLYTAPGYEALVSDVDLAKELGFNMIRKHIKVEPEVWYEYCDRNGILVWQDMPSGDMSGTDWQNRDYYKGTEKHRSPESDLAFRTEWKEIIDHLYNHPCIAVWVPFNEGWGQYDTDEITEWTKAYDPTRLVNGASGGNYFFSGDVLDMHQYPAPGMCLLSDKKANVCGEFGGIGYAVPEHLWFADRNWGYIQFASPREVTDEYVKYLGILDELAKIAYTGGVYTQTTDVEGEVNGLVTYDRKVLKMDTDRVSHANRSLIRKYSE